MKKMAVNFVLSLWYSPGLGGQFSVVLVSFLSLYINNWEKSTNPKKKKVLVYHYRVSSPWFLGPIVGVCDEARGLLISKQNKTTKQMGEESIRVGPITPFKDMTHMT
jgi:hypothetical protein